jgi:hypothetical protein
LGGEVSSRDSRAAHQVIAMPSAQIGRLIQKISRQSTSISRPPTSGPIASARAETAAQIPRACPCCSTGKAWLTIASDSESIAAPPAPWTTRAATRTASSEATAASTEPAPNTAIPIRKTRRRPAMSPSRPAVTTRTLITSR